MQYRRFTISDYRAITGPLTVDVVKSSLIPIIGINECGKTTILQAIFSFDCYNDELNDGGRHLKDVGNLYSTTRKPATIKAEIDITPSEFVDVLDELGDEHAEVAKGLRRKRSRLPKPLSITRNLSTKKYTFHSDIIADSDVGDVVAQEIVRQLPYILYFDDFRDSVEELIEIPSGDKPLSSWGAIVEQLFRVSGVNCSIRDLPKLEERQRKSVLAKAKKHLNETLTREWQNFRLDQSDALQISIDYTASGSGSETRNFVKLEIIEVDADGHEHYFFIRDRSKGFYWFFNFVMKTEFNPKAGTDTDGAIYLLDEPGSYLHASAQSKLCRKLRQLSNSNKVIYCTHSHYLLDPEAIPLSAVRIADKSDRGAINMMPIHEHHGNILERRSAFQPVIDALHIKPFLLDMSHQHVVIVEGIYDYYAMEIFKGQRNVNILPSVGADSIKYYISLMIAWRVAYKALWDNDDEGRKEHALGSKVFGEDEAKRCFFMLPLENGRKKARLETLFDEEELGEARKQLGIPANASFEKTIASMFFSTNRAELLRVFAVATRHNFEKVFQHIGAG